MAQSDYVLEPAVGPGLASSADYNANNHDVEDTFGAAMGYGILSGGTGAIGTGLNVNMVLSSFLLGIKLSKAAIAVPVNANKTGANTNRIWAVTDPSDPERVVYRVLNDGSTLARGVLCCTADTNASNVTSVTNNPTGRIDIISNAAALAEVQAARGSMGSLDARLDVHLNENGTPKAFAANQSFGGFKATSLADGTASTDGATKGQLDAAIAGVSSSGFFRIVKEFTAAGGADDFQLVIDIPSAGVAVGNTLLIAFVESAFSYATDVAVSDTKGNQYYVDVDVSDGAGAGNSNRLVIIRGIISTALVDADAITIVHPSSSDHSAEVLEVEGILTKAGALDVAASTYGNSTSPASGNTAASKTAPLLVFGGITFEDGSGVVTLTLASGWTSLTRRHDDVRYVQAAYKSVLDTDQLLNFSGTFGSALKWCAGVCGYRLTVSDANARAMRDSGAVDYGHVRALANLNDGDTLQLTVEGESFTYEFDNNSSISDPDFVAVTIGGSAGATMDNLAAAITATQGSGGTNRLRVAHTSSSSIVELAVRDVLGNYALTIAESTSGARMATATHGARRLPVLAQLFSVIYTVTAEDVSKGYSQIWLPPGITITFYTWNFFTGTANQTNINYTGSISVGADNFKFAFDGGTNLAAGNIIQLMVFALPA